ncbi:CrcB family protein [Bifidobacterium sp. 64T4]|uniref:fluoride efflux transporter FluC n=1 Tax=Bifidobacterium pongonis TaxID=2834432 RepID=UPI001C5A0173|nr:CrcB family protein [Bifidobacterium pongonis]MBW3094365.1 CrcB family protein [Bifidobacterium pongonis]
MEPQSSNGRDGAGDVAARQDAQQHAMPTMPIMPDLDVPSLDVPNLGEITSTFEPITDVPPSGAVAASSPAVPQHVSVSPESDVRGGAQDAYVSISPESVTHGTADSARVSFSGESDNRGEAWDAGVSDSPESDSQGAAGGVGMSDSPESDTLGEQEAGLGAAASVTPAASAASAASAADPESLPKAKPALFTAEPKEPGLSTQEMSEVHASAYARSIPHPTGAAAAERPPQIPLAPVKRVRAQFNPLADGLLYLVVFVGGFLGTAMRYGLSLAFPAPEDASGFLGAFRWPTFGANMLACFLLAVITVCVSQASWLTRRVKQVISNGAGLGLCGGCSTLSTLGIEELTSFHDGEIGGALTYVLVTFACGVLCSIIGVKVGLLLTARRKSQVLREAVRNAALSKDGSVPVVEGRAFGANGGSDAAEALIAADAPIVVDKPVAVPSGDPDAQDARDTAVVSVSEETATGIPAFEPAPITDEIPLVGDLMTGEVRVVTEAERDANIGAVSTGEFPAVPAVTDAASPDAATSDAVSNIVPNAALAEQQGEGVER